MKGNKKLLVIAVLLLLVAVSYTTYAIYKTSVAGNAEVTAAKWNVAFKNGQTTISTTQNLVLTCANNAHVKDGVIAPGASCTGTLTIDADDTEVDVTYSVTAGTPTLGGTALSGDENDWTISLSDGTTTSTTLTGSIGWANSTRTKDITVTLAWGKVDDSEATPADTINKADTDLQGETITVPLTLVAKQVVE